VPELATVPPDAAALALAMARDVLKDRALGRGEVDVESTAMRSHSIVTVIGVRARGRTRRYYLKTLRATDATLELKRAQARREFDVLVELERRLWDDPELGAVRPVRCWPDQLSLLTEEFPGEKLARALSRGRGPGRAAAELAGLCRRVGRWLALFQALVPPAGAATVEDLLGYCERRLRLLVDCRPRDFRDLAGPLARRLESLAAAIDPADLRSVARHNDFRPDNIMTDGVRVAVLDFTGFTGGPALYDFVKFWMKLDDLAFGVSYRPSVVESWKQAFTDGYGVRPDVGSPICVLLRAGNVLDKLSEAAASARPQSLAAGLILAVRSRQQVAGLRRLARGDGL
jgi:hypothetical protein